MVPCARHLLAGCRQNRKPLWRDRRRWGAARRPNDRASDLDAAEASEVGKRVAPHAASGLQRAHDDARLDFVFGGMLDFCQCLTSRSENLRRTVRIPFCAYGPQRPLLALSRRSLAAIRRPFRAPCSRWTTDARFPSRLPSCWEDTFGRRLRASSTTRRRSGSGCRERDHRPG